MSRASVPRAASQFDARETCNFESGLCSSRCGGDGSSLRMRARVHVAETSGHCWTERLLLRDRPTKKNNTSIFLPELMQRTSGPRRKKRPETRPRASLARIKLKIKQSSGMVHRTTEHPHTQCRTHTRPAPSTLTGKHTRTPRQTVRAEPCYNPNNTRTHDETTFPTVTAQNIEKKR